MLLEDFNKPQLDMRPSRISEDVISNVYIYLIERFASDAGKKAGEFYTPHKVSELVAKLCKPKVDTRICDPAYGWGGLLIEAAVEKEGCVAIVVPHGVLFHGAAEGRIREKGGANEDRKDVIFIDASQDYQLGKNQNALMDENMEKILNAYEVHEEIEKYAHLASYDELKENDFNLNIPRYVNTFEEETEIDIETVQQKIDTLEGELVEVRVKMTNLLKEVAA